MAVGVAVQAEARQLTRGGVVAVAHQAPAVAHPVELDQAEERQDAAQSGAPPQNLALTSAGANNAEVTVAFMLIILKEV